MTDSNALSRLGDTDPRTIGRAEFVDLLRAAAERAGTESGADLGSMTPEQFARLISRASTDQIEAVMQRPELAELVLDEVFRRMGAHYEPGRTRDTEAVVRWRVGDDPDTALRYECVLTGDTCTVSKEPRHEPRVTITVGPVDFLRVASGNASPATMLMRGRLKVAGDVGFATGLTKLFRIPRA